MSKLNNIGHEEFCQEFVKTNHATKSYQKAYPEAGERSAASSAQNLLKKSNIIQRIEEIRVKVDKKSTMEAEDVLRCWESIAKFNVSDIMEFNGTEAYVKDFSQVPREVLYNVKSIETQRLGKGDDQTLVTKITFYSKEKALDALARIKSMYNDKLKVENKSIEDYLREISK